MATADNQELVDRFEQFYRRYYSDEIGELARNYPSEQRSLYVDWTDLYRFDPDLADDFISQPEQLLEYAEEALRLYDLPVDVSLGQAHVRVRNLSEMTEIRDIRSRHVNNLVSVQGMVRKATDVRPKIREAAFECQRCGTLTYIPQSGGDFQEPHECEGCERQGPFQINFDQSEFIDSQKLRVQESPEGLRGGETPQSIDVHVEDDITGEVTPGDHVNVTGVLHLDQQTSGGEKSPVFDVYMDGLAIEIEDEEFEDMDITDEDKQAIVELSERNDIYEQMVNSIAPSIYGYEEAKMAMILQLFSGVTKHLPDGSRTRGDLHMLLIGDPGTGKCVSGDTRVTLADGSEEKIRELVERNLDDPTPVDDGVYDEVDFTVPSLDVDGSVTTQRATKVWKREAPDRMYRIRTANGTEVEVTPSHPLFVQSSGAFAPKKAENLSEGEFVATPKELPTDCDDTLDVIPEVGDELRRIRKALALSQFDCGLPRSTYQHYERGDRNPSRQSLLSVVEAFEERLERLSALYDAMTAGEWTEVELARRKLGVSQQTLADGMDVTQTAVSYYEREGVAPDGGRVDDAKAVVLDRLERTLGVKDDVAALRSLAEGPVSWERIERIEAVEPDDDWVYDLEVAGTHNYVTNNVFSHNSALLQYIRNIAPRSVYTSGKGSSSAGLTAAAVRDDFGDGQQWTLEAGALVLADQGIAAVDELDKMRCVTGDTLVHLGDGRVSRIRDLAHDAAESGKIEELENGRTIRDLDFDAWTMTDDGRLVRRPVTAIHEYDAPEELTSVRLESGEELTATDDHPFFVFEDGERVEKPAAELDDGDWAYVPRRLSKPASDGGVSVVPSPTGQNRTGVSPALGAVLGYLSGDGNVYYDRDEGVYGIRFTNAEEELLADFERACREAFDAEPVRPPSEQREDGVETVRLSGREYADAGLDAGMNLETYDGKTLPEGVTGGSRATKAAFARALADSEGSVDVETGNVKIHSSSYELLLGVKSLLLEFDVSSQIQTRERDRGRDLYILAITAAGSLAAFHRHVGFTLDRKQSALQEVCDAASGDRTIIDVIPDCGDLLVNLRDSLRLHQSECGINAATYCNFENGDANVSLRLARDVLDAFKERKRTTDEDVETLLCVPSWGTLTELKDRYHVSQAELAEGTEYTQQAVSRKWGENDELRVVVARRLRAIVESVAATDLGPFQSLVRGDVRWRRIESVEATEAETAGDSVRLLRGELADVLGCTPESAVEIARGLLAVEPTTDSWGSLRAELNRHGVSFAAVARDLGVAPSTVSRWFNGVAETERFPEVRAVALERIQSVRNEVARFVDEIETRSEPKVYDLTVEGTHNFVANGMVVHNSEDRSAMHEALEQQSYHPDSEVLLADGRRVEIGELVDDRMDARPGEVVDGVDCEILPVDDVGVHSVDLGTNEVEKLPVDRVSRHEAPEEFVRVTFSNGREVMVTPEHPMFVDDEGEVNTVEARDIEKGAFVPAPRKLPNSSTGVELAGEERVGKEKDVALPEEMTPDLAEFLGLLVAEGHSYAGSAHEIGFSNQDGRLLDRAAELARRVFGMESTDTTNAAGTVTKRWVSTKLYRWFEENFPEVMHTARGKRIPAAVLGASEEAIRRFLVGAFAGDGGVESEAMSFSTASEMLAQDYADALAKLGVASRIHHDDTEDSWKTYVMGDSTEVFVDAVVEPADDRYEDARAFVGRSNETPRHHDVLPTSAARELRALKRLLGVRLTGKFRPHVDEGYGVQVETVERELERLRERAESVGAALAAADDLAAVRDAVGWSGRQLAERLDGETTSAIHYAEDGGYDDQRRRRLTEQARSAVREALAEFERRADALEARCDLRYYRVTDVETVVNAGEYECDWVYDVTVESTNTFVSQGVVLHNSISVSKAGINATLKSRCSLLGAANPKYGRFDQYEPIGEQIDLEPALISRFDLIFTVTDQPDPEHDRELAEHILTTNYAGELNTHRSEVATSNVSEEEVAEATEEVEPDIDAELLRKYVAYAKRNCYPTMTDGARERIEEFYVDLRSKGAEEDAPVPVTARQLEALVRLGEASARIRLSDEVTEEDADRVIEIVRSCLQDIGVDPETGQYDADVVETGTSKTQRDRIKNIRGIIGEIEDEYEEGAPVEEVLSRAEDVGMERSKAEHEIEKLKQRGEVYEPSTDHLRTTG